MPPNDDDDRRRREPQRYSSGGRPPTGAGRPAFDPRAERQSSLPSSGDAGARIEALAQQILAVTEKAPERQREMLDGQASIEGRLISLNAEVKRLNERLADVEEEQDRSGEHRMVELTRERDELKEARRHWVRYLVTAIVSLIAGGVLMALGRLLH